MYIQLFQQSINGFKLKYINNQNCWYTNMFYRKNSSKKYKKRWKCTCKRINYHGIISLDNHV